MKLQGKCDEIDGKKQEKCQNRIGAFFECGSKKAKRGANAGLAWAEIKKGLSLFCGLPARPKINRGGRLLLFYIPSKFTS